MSRKILEIYEEYRIMPNLQEHMLRVAAVSSLICDNFDEPLPKEEIITACLLHDMGNIIKSKFEFFSEFLEPKGLEYWQQVKDEYVKKYSNDEHVATKEIMSELGIQESVIRLASENYFPKLCENIKVNDFKLKIIQYSDMRVGPYGVLSYEGRMEEANERYKNRPEYLGKGEIRLRLVSCGKEIEKQIFAKCKIKPEDITDEAVQSIISELREFVIK